MILKKKKKLLVIKYQVFTISTILLCAFFPPIDFYSEKHSFVDMPVQEEFYRAIERHGSSGCSLTDICNYTGMHHYNIRHLIKKAVSDGLITSYNVDVGRQRTNMYVAIQYSNTIKANKNEKNDVLQNIQCSAEPVSEYRTIKRTKFEFFLL